MKRILKDFLLFFKIDILQIRNYYRFEKNSAYIRTLIMFFIIFMFVLFEIGVSFDLFKYIMKQESLGELRLVLLAKLLNMVFLIFTALLVYSNIIMSISAFYTSDKLDLIHVRPVSETSIFLYAFFETFMRSSWMFIVFGVPILFVYGITFKKALLFFPQLILVVLPLLVLPAGIGVITGTFLMLIFSPKRTKRALFVTGVILSVGLVLIFRWMRPEQLIDPIGVEQLTLYLNTLRVPTIDWLPSTWAAEAFSAYGEGHFRANLKYSGYLWMSSIISVGFSYLFFRLFWWRGRSGSRGVGSEKKKRFQAFRLLLVPEKSPVTFLKRDIIIFIRDPSQWTQLIIIAALITIYVFNFKNLPYALYGFQYSMTFVSLGATGLILAAILARFAYPSVSLESQSFWILQTAPINWKKYLWYKFFFSLIPTLFIGLLLIVFSLVILDVSRDLIIRCILGTIYICVGSTGLAVGLGARNPKFSFEDAAQIAVSTGGLIFMIWSIGFVGFVIVFTVAPDAIRFFSQFWRIVRTFHNLDRFFFQLALVITTYFLTVIPMRMGIKTLEEKMMN